MNIPVSRRSGRGGHPFSGHGDDGAGPGAWPPPAATSSTSASANPTCRPRPRWSRPRWPPSGPAPPPIPTPWACSQLRARDRRPLPAPLRGERRSRAGSSSPPGPARSCCCSSPPCSRRGTRSSSPIPGYACYPNFIRFFGGRPRSSCRPRAEDGFQPRPAAVRALLTARTRGVLINSPANPAGSLLPPRLAAGVGLPAGAAHRRRDLPWPELRGRGAQHPRVHRPGLRPRWLFQDLRHDRLAPRLPDRPASLHAGPAEHAPELSDLRRQLRPAGRHRRPARLRRTRWRRCAGSTTGAAGAWSRGCGTSASASPQAPDGAFYVLADARHIDGDSLAPGRRDPRGRPASPSPRGSISAPAPRGSCASPTPTPWKTSGPPATVSPPFWPPAAGAPFPHRHPQGAEPC